MMFQVSSNYNSEKEDIFSFSLFFNLYILTYKLNIFIKIIYNIF